MCRWSTCQAFASRITSIATMMEQYVLTELRSCASPPARLGKRCPCAPVCLQIIPRADGVSRGSPIVRLCHLTIKIPRCFSCAATATTRVPPREYGRRAQCLIRGTVRYQYGDQTTFCDLVSLSDVTVDRTRGIAGAKGWPRGRAHGLSRCTCHQCKSRPL